jgi:hypothetical protein
MPASAAEYKMELSHDISAFYRRTGTILNPNELIWLGLKADDLTAIFDEDEVKILHEFCKDNSEYHIITITEPGRLENLYVPDKRVYYLAKGDKNPNLAVNPFVGPDAEVFMERVANTVDSLVAAIHRDAKTKRRL